MIEAVMNLLLAAMAAVITMLWIVAVVEADGECHTEDCEDCLFPCGRSMEGKR